MIDWFCTYYSGRWGRRSPPPLSPLRHCSGTRALGQSRPHQNRSRTGHSSVCLSHAFCPLVIQISVSAIGWMIKSCDTANEYIILIEAREWQVLTCIYAGNKEKSMATLVVFNRSWRSKMNEKSDHQKELLSHHFLGGNVYSKGILWKWFQHIDTLRTISDLTYCRLSGALGLNVPIPPRWGLYI